MRLLRLLATAPLVSDAQKSATVAEFAKNSGLRLRIRDVPKSRDSFFRD